MGARAHSALRPQGAESRSTHLCAGARGAAAAVRPRGSFLRGADPARAARAAMRANVGSTRVQVHAASAESAVLLLEFLSATLSSFTPAAADATIRSVMRIVELGHPLLTHCAAEVIASCAARPATPLSATMLAAIIDGLLLHCSPASGGGAPTARLTLSGCADRAALLDACCAAATALLPRDKSACVARLLPLCRALLREIRARDGTRAREGPDIPPEAGGTGLGDQLCELLRCCAHPQLPSKSAMAVAEALGECLSSDCRHAWTSVLEARAQHPT